MSLKDRRTRTDRQTDRQTDKPNDRHTNTDAETETEEGKHFFSHSEQSVRSK